MIKEVLDYSLIAAVSAITGLIVIFIAGSILQRAMMDAATVRKIGKAAIALSFFLFLVLGFSIIPLAVGIFIPLLEQVIPAPVDFISQNDMLIVYALWVIYAVGLIIALPRMIKDGFFEGG
jgi:hypothetical protein